MIRLPGDEALKAARELAAAKKAYSESFLRHRIRAKTDTQAEHMATVECGEELTLAQARYELALRQS